jgi:hypothetical protein
MAPIADTAETLARLYRAGKINAIGVSNFSPAEMEIFRSATPLHTVQRPYNLFERAIDANVLPYCRGPGLWLPLPWSAVGTDDRGHEVHWRRPPPPRYEIPAAPLCAVSPGRRATVADARRFVLRLPHLTDNRDAVELQKAWPPAGGHPRSPEGRACVAAFAAGNRTAKPML